VLSHQLPALLQRFSRFEKLCNGFMLQTEEWEGRACLFVLSVQKVAIVILVQGVKLRSKGIKGGRMRILGGLDKEVFYF
jgi:hypothetical protein